MPNYNDVVRRYEKATEDVREAVGELRLASIAFGYEDGRKDAGLREISETIITPEMQTELWQRKRDEIVEKAKLVVENMENDIPSNTFYNFVDYVVNNEKRTVVALLRCFKDGEVVQRGTAKCDPEDCFNMHIGKVIAVLRALRIKVPHEYLNAPNPTEVRVGDVIEYAREFSKAVPEGQEIGDSGEYCWTTSAFAEQGKIIDDSRE